MVTKEDKRGRPLKKIYLADGACPTIKDPDSFVEKARKSPKKRNSSPVPAKDESPSTSKALSHDHTYFDAKPRPSRPDIKYQPKQPFPASLSFGDPKPQTGGDVNNNLIKSLQDQVKVLQHKVEKHESLWRSEQSDLIYGFKAKTIWSDDVIVRCVELRFIIGSTGYEHLRKVWHLPLPSISTLNERMKILKIQPGLSPDCAKLAEIKAKKLDEDDREAILVIDEMSTQPKLEWDKSNKCVSGFITIPEKDADIPLNSQGIFKLLLFNASANTKSCYSSHSTIKTTVSKFFIRGRY